MAKQCAAVSDSDMRKRKGAESPQAKRRKRIESPQTKRASKSREDSSGNSTSIVTGGSTSNSLVIRQNIERELGESLDKLLRAYTSASQIDTWPPAAKRFY